MESKLNFKTYIPWTVAITAIIIAFIITSLRGCDNKQIAQQTQAADIKQIDLSQVKIWKDKYNQLHYQLERTQVDKAVVQVQVDNLAKMLKIKTKQVQQFSYVKSGVHFQGKLQTYIIHDTIRDTIDNTRTTIPSYQKFTYSDKWMQIKGDLGKTDSIYIKGQDTLVRVDYWKRKWFLGRKHYYVDFSNKNPYIQLQGFKQLEIQPTTSRFSFGPHIGVSYQLSNLSQPQISIGISLQYNLIKF